MKRYLRFMWALFLLYVEDIFVMAGLGTLVYATHLIHPIAALYLIGVFFVIFGVFLSKKPPKGGKI